mgnify:CR=1 FL=1
MKKQENAVATTHKSYLVESPESETGEIVLKEKYLYFEGRPREYRFNGQNGQFNRYGDHVLTDPSGRLLTEFTFQPIAYRTFEDCLFGRLLREQWAELFFIDSDDCVASIMFNNTSVTEFYRLLEPILYERKSLCDIVLTVKPERITGKADPNKIWYIARFTYKPADPVRTAELTEYAKDHRIYRAETIQPSAVHKLVSENFAIVDVRMETDVYDQPSEYAA